MMPVSPSLPRALRRRSHALAVVALLLAACSAPTLDAPLASPDAMRVARAPSGPTVTKATPAYADRGTTLDVHVIGSGFTAGAQATWLLHGNADPAHVRTNSTTVVSSTEVVANITVASDADLAYWDVQIALAGGKNGVGTELFEITTAMPIGGGTWVQDMNDLGQVVGGPGAYVYDDSFGFLDLGAGQTGAVDPLGTMVLGRDASNSVMAWVRQGTNNSYVTELLPKLAGSVGGNALAAARDATGALLVGGWQIMPGAKKGTTLNRPVFWRHDVAWSAPTPLALPPGYTTGSVRGLNGKGQLVGRLDNSQRGAVYDDLANPIVLDGLPNSINGAGTLVVGVRAGLPVYWYRNASGAWNTVGVTLPSLGGTCGGEASGLNDDGVVVGKSCDTAGNIEATVWRLTVGGGAPVLVAGPQRLPGLGLKRSATSNESSSAMRVSGTAPYVIAGAASGQSGTLVVRWRTW
jgi:hypothetical protein